MGPDALEQRMQSIVGEISAIAIGCKQNSIDCRRVHLNVANTIVSYFFQNLQFYSIAGQ